jgi:predicted metal-binding membrane protein
VLAGAGVYQLTAVKDRGLTRCHAAHRAGRHGLRRRSGGRPCRPGLPNDELICNLEQSKPVT